MSTYPQQYTFITTNTTDKPTGYTNLVKEGPQTTH